MFATILRTLRQLLAECKFRQLFNFIESQIKVPPEKKKAKLLQSKMWRVFYIFFLRGCSSKVKSVMSEVYFITVNKKNYQNRN